MTRRCTRAGGSVGFELNVKRARRVNLVVAHMKQIGATVSRVSRRKLQFTVRFLLVLLAFAAVLAFGLRPRRVNVEFAIDRYTNEWEAGSNAPYIAAHVRVTNRSPNAIWYYGAAGQPAVGAFNKVGTEWDWYGYDFSPYAPVKLGRGETVQFELPLLEDAEELKVGIKFSTRPNGQRSEVWSTPFAVPRPGLPNNGTQVDTAHLAGIV